MRGSMLGSSRTPRISGRAGDQERHDADGHAARPPGTGRRVSSGSATSTTTSRNGPALMLSPTSPAEQELHRDVPRGDRDRRRRSTSRGSLPTSTAAAPMSDEQRRSRPPPEPEGDADRRRAGQRLRPGGRPSTQASQPFEQTICAQSPCHCVTETGEARDRVGPRPARSGRGWPARRGRAQVRSAWRTYAVIDAVPSHDGTPARPMPDERYSEVGRSTSDRSALSSAIRRGSGRRGGSACRR